MTIPQLIAIFVRNLKNHIKGGYVKIQESILVIIFVIFSQKWQFRLENEKIWNNSEFSLPISASGSVLGLAKFPNPGPEQGPQNFENLGSSGPCILAYNFGLNWPQFLWLERKSCFISITWSIRIIFSSREFIIKNFFHHMTSDWSVGPCVFNIHAINTIFINDHCKSFIKPSISCLAMQKRFCISIQFGLNISLRISGRAI